MQHDSEKPRDRKLSPAQTLAWRVMTLIAMVCVFLTISNDHDIRQPFVAGIFILISVLIAFFSRKYIRDNTDSNGKRLKK